jgi:pimeloyl-ACP methyl ester carboxylesterase
VPAIETRDAWIDTPPGKLYLRHWRPAPPSVEASPIVLFHDSLGCVELWRDFPEHLAAATGCSVIAYDRLGFGKSDPHPGLLDLGFVHAEAEEGFRRLIEALELDRFVAFGHSVGGGMAIAGASVHAARCRALITESAQEFVEDRTLQGIRNAKRTFSEPGQMQRLEKYHGDKAAWVLRAWVDSWLDPRFHSWNADADLRGLRCPVLAIHGENDEFGSCRHPRRIAELAPGPTTVCILEDCGHVPHREQQQAVVERIRAWLEGCA